MLRIVLQTYATGQHTAANHLKFENLPVLNVFHTFFKNHLIFIIPVDVTNGTYYLFSITPVFGEVRSFLLTVIPEGFCRESPIFLVVVVVGQV